MSDDFRHKSERTAIWLWFQAGIVGMAVIAGSVVMFFHSRIPFILIQLPGIAALVLSALLAFDAYLFRMIATQTDEVQGCRSVDEFLAGAGLKRMQQGTRGLTSRIAGTRRLVYAQCIFAGLFGLGFVFWIRPS